MRRLIAIALLAAASACGSDSVLAPVQTVDGEWKGTQNGYALSLSMVQTGTTIAQASCSAVIGSNGGFITGTCEGTFVYPNLAVKITVPGFFPIDYTATMSQAEAKMFGHMNGSGLNNIEMDLRKQ
jgi:hypothetical protein